jgi:hypothetical protein
MGQKRMEKIVSNQDISTLVIEGANFSEIHIAAKDVPTIHLIATIAGETFENVLLTTKQETSVFKIGLGYTPFFIPDNDKLAAHKVMSIRLDMVVPEGMDLQVLSTSAHVSFEGAFGIVIAQGGDGNYTLLDFEGSGTIITKKGDIKGSVSANVLVVNQLKNQNQHAIINTIQQHLIRVGSKGGNVSISQTK